MMSGAKRARTADLLHAISRQHVHPRPYPQVTVLPRPRKSARVRTCCGTFLLYHSHPRRGPQRAPDEALTGANPAHQVTGAPSGVHAVKEATEAGPTTPPQPPPQPGAGQPDSPTNIQPGFRGLHSNFGTGISVPSRRRHPLATQMIATCSHTGPHSAVPALGPVRGRRRCSRVTVCRPGVRAWPVRAPPRGSPSAGLCARAPPGPLGRLRHGRRWLVVPPGLRRR